MGIWNCEASEKCKYLSIFLLMLVDLHLFRFLRIHVFTIAYPSLQSHCSLYSFRFAHSFFQCLLQRHNSDTVEWQVRVQDKLLTWLKVESVTISKDFRPVLNSHTVVSVDQIRILAMLLVCLKWLRIVWVNRKLALVKAKLRFTEVIMLAYIPKRWVKKGNESE